MVRAAMASARESKDTHAGCHGRADARLAVLDHDAGVRPGGHPIGGEQKQIRRRLAAFDMGRAEDMRVEVAQEADQ